MNQDEIFARKEGNAWFRRNQASLENPGKVDWPLAVLEMLGNKDGIRNVAELGCANGYRLDRLCSKLSTKGRFVGVDASEEAISDGCKRYPHLELHTGTLAELPVSGAFDLVIVNFVLHWVDRKTLARSISEIDRLTTDGGLLLIGDFLPDFPQRRNYHHYRDADVYTYKQDYAMVFAALGTYKEMVRVTFDHDHPGVHVQKAGSASRGMCALLHKSLNDYYIEPA
jgi:SAM-dependent methyltransferase